MLLQPGGLDIFYVDESHDKNHYVVTAVRIPFLRKVEGAWEIVWPNHLGLAKRWRKEIKTTLNIPVSKELHGLKLASGRGHFLYGKFNLKHKQAAEAYRQILRNLIFVPDKGIMSVVASRGKYLYGHDRLEAAMYALFQTMLAALGCAMLQVLAIGFHGYRGEFPVLPLTVILFALAAFVLWSRASKAPIAARG